jgi:multiple sugar transport system permease protein
MRSKVKSTKKIIRDNLAGWSFVLPAFLFLFLFMIYPIIHTFILCFQEYDFVYDKSPTFVGFRNFIEILEMPSFIKAIGNTFYFFLVYVPTIFILGFFVGLLFSSTDLLASKVSKIVLFVPMAIPVSMSCFMFLFMLNPQWGLVNSFLKDYLGLAAWTRDWMNDPSSALNVIIFVTVWQRIGFIGLLFMAGLQAIPQSVIEASVIDGANRWQRMTRILVPNLRETYLVVGILAIITSIKIFAQVVAMTGAGGVNNAGGPANATLTLYVATYRAAFINYDMGIGSAMGYFMSVIIVILFAINFYINKAERA